MEKKKDVGVIVGRFQVPDLTNAHKDIIQHVAAVHSRIVIMIGVSPTLVTRDNPLDYLTRAEMLRSEFPEAVISHLADQRTNEGWSKSLDTAIRSLIPIGSVCLYGGRDSFISSYNGTFETQEIPSAYYDESGTQVRDNVRSEVLATRDFRAGVIYAAQNQYPKVYPTVDMALTRSLEGGGRSVLLGRKDLASNKYSFPGGFVDPTDESYESAALREVFEEIDAEVDRNLHYVSSHRIADWRYKRSEKIMTSFFEAKLTFGSGTPKEEFCETTWFPIDSKLISVISESHLPLAEALLMKYNKL